MGFEQKLKESKSRHQELQQKGIRGVGDLIRFLKSGIEYAGLEKKEGKIKAEHAELKREAEKALEKLQQFERNNGIS